MSKEKNLFIEELEFLNRRDIKFLATEVQTLAHRKYLRLLFIDFLIGLPFGAFLTLKLLNMLNVIQIPDKARGDFDSIWVIVIASVCFIVQLGRFLNDIYEIRLSIRTVMD